MFSVIRRLCSAAAFLLVASATAAPIRFDFTGVVTDDAINGCGGVVSCGAVTGSYEFDSAAVDGNPAAGVGLYDASAISFYIDGVLFFSAASGAINVVDGALADQYGLLAAGDGNGSAAELSILLEDLTRVAFASDALPLDGLSPLLTGGFTLNALDDAFQLLGSITAISCGSGCGGGGQVPEPATLLLLVAGLLGLGACRRRACRTG